MWYDDPPRQLCVVIVSAGVVLATVSRPNTKSATITLESMEDTKTYIIGISMMVASSVATGFLGLLQELTYQTYGPCWKEGVFYTVRLLHNAFCLPLTCFNQHFLSLPVFAFLLNDIKLGISRLSSTSSGAPFAFPFIVLLCNVITQLICVSGVNKLSAVGLQLFRK
jgi:UDP-xylose/UDP-N-acetylglucosamine transporter B4